MRKDACILFCVLAVAICFAEFDARKEVIKLMENGGFGKYLVAPVTITQSDSGALSIRDEGIFAFQHALLTPEAATDPNVVIGKGVYIGPNADKLVVVVHGWMDTGENAWPSEMAAVIGERTDPNEWDLTASVSGSGGTFTDAIVEGIRFTATGAFLRAVDI